MPLLTALAGLAVGVTGVYLVSNIATVSSTAPSLALMIGLAVGIDYSVFILSRYRSELTAGQAPRHAIEVALGTAVSAVGVRRSHGVHRARRRPPVLSPAP